MNAITLCGIPVELNPDAPADKIVLHPSVAQRIEARILDDAANFRALKHLYHAIVKMSKSGIGYSPETSDAIKKLKQIPSLQP